jgi:hypothetical protein
MQFPPYEQAAIKRELDALRRAFRLAVQAERLLQCPHEVVRRARPRRNLAADNAGLPREDFAASHKGIAGAPENKAAA